MSKRLNTRLRNELRQYGRKTIRAILCAFTGAVLAPVAPKDQGVAGVERLEETVELRAFAGEAGGVRDEDAIASGLVESADLELGILIDTGDAGLADAQITVTLENSSAGDCCTAT